MIYLIVFFLSLSYIFLLEVYGSTRSVSYWFIALIPIYFILFLIPAFQDGIGTDYHNYYDAYYTDYIRIFFNKGELFIFYIYVFLRNWDLGPQSFFYVMTVLNLALLGFTLALLKRFGYSILIVFFIWFVVTNYYHNQMNIIRQFFTVFAFPLLLLLLIEKRYFYSAIIATLAFFSHQIFIVMLAILGGAYFLRKFLVKKYIFLIFFCSFFLYSFILPGASYFLVDFFVPTFKRYYSGTGLSGANLVFLLTKLIYVPLFLLFFYIYYFKKSFYTFFISKHKYFDFFIAIFAATALSFILLLFVDRFNRIYVYFAFFSIFPLYYLYAYFLSKKSHIFIFLLTSYLFLPYFAKVFIFPVREFSFSTILF